MPNGEWRMQNEDRPRCATVRHDDGDPSRTIAQHPDGTIHVSFDYGARRDASLAALDAVHRRLLSDRVRGLYRIRRESRRAPVTAIEGRVRRGLSRAGHARVG